MMPILFDILAGCVLGGIKTAAWQDCQVLLTQIYRDAEENL